MIDTSRRQFVQKSKKQKYYDRKLWKSGNTRGISIGKIIPADWLYVRAYIADQGPDWITVQFIKLAGVTSNAHTPTSHKANKSNA